MRIVIFFGGPLNGHEEILEEGDSYIYVRNNKQYVYKATGEKDILKREFFKLEK